MLRHHHHRRDAVTISDVELGLAAVLLFVAVILTVIFVPAVA